MTLLMRQRARFYAGPIFNMSTLFLNPKIERADRPLLSHEKGGRQKEKAKNFLPGEELFGTDRFRPSRAGLLRIPLSRN